MSKESGLAINWEGFAKSVLEVATGREFEEIHSSNGAVAIWEKERPKSSEKEILTIDLGILRSDHQQDIVYYEKDNIGVRLNGPAGTISMTMNEENSVVVFSNGNEHQLIEIEPQI